MAGSEWFKPCTAEEYLTRLMIQAYGMHPDDIPKLWQVGYLPPKPYLDGKFRNERTT